MFIAIKSQLYENKFKCQSNIIFIKSNLIYNKILMTKYLEGSILKYVRALEWDEGEYLKS